MRILLTNDDGVQSPVLRRAAEAVSEAHEVIVAAPADDQSGRAHAFTHGPDNLLRCQEETGFRWRQFRVHGTPADCVKFAVSRLLRDNLPDLVISGPNLGENAGISAVYSGTVAAAREAALWGIPAVAASISGRSPAHLDAALAWLLAMLREGGTLPAPGSLWNVNFPPCDPSGVAGTRVARMSTVMFRDRYEEVRTAHALPGYRLLGHKPAEEFADGTDDDLLRRGFVTVAPLRVSQEDEAAYAALKPLEAGMDAALREALNLPAPAPRG